MAVLGRLPITESCKQSNKHILTAQSQTYGRLLLWLELW